MFFAIRVAPKQLKMFKRTFCLFFLVPIVHGQTFPFVDISACLPGQFFNSANQQCQDCASYVANTEATSSSKFVKCGLC